MSNGVRTGGRSVPASSSRPLVSSDRPPAAIDPRPGGQAAWVEIRNPVFFDLSAPIDLENRPPIVPRVGGVAPFRS